MEDAARPEVPAPARPMAGLAAQYSTPLVRFVRRRGFTTDAAEGGAQEVFVRMLGLEDRSRIDNALIMDRTPRDVVRQRIRATMPSTHLL